MDGKVDRRSGSIVLYDDANEEEVGRWNFVEAWPSKWTGPTFNATANDVAVEMIELAFESAKENRVVKVRNKN